MAGRFISFDPLIRGINHAKGTSCRKSITDFPLNHPKKLHPFIYTDNNPINFVDPKGLACGPGTLGDIVFPDNWFGWYSFESACSQHDNCYGTCGRSKTQCDDEFLQNMLNTCASLTAGSYWRNHCEGIADIYYEAVRSRGQNSYNSAQKEACCN